MSATFTALLRAEGTKLARQPSSYVLAAILVAYLGLMVVAFVGILGSPPRPGLDTDALLAPLRADAVGFLSGVATSIATILVVVVGAQSVAHELSRGTLRTLLLSGAGRVDLALAKIALLGLASATLAVVVTLGAIAGAAALTAATGEDLLRVSTGGVLVQLGRTAVGLALWSWIALGTTLLTRSLGVGIGATMGTLLAGDVLGGLLTRLGTAGEVAARALPHAAIQRLTSSTLGASDLLWIVPNLLVYVVALVAWGILRLRTMDVVAATK